MQGLDTLLRPRSVAIIGASDDPRTFSGASVFNLQRHAYTGAIYPVNPKRAELMGLRCYPSVMDIPGSVDTAIIAVPSAVVLPVMTECVRKGITSATIVTSGFGAESAGEAGRERADRLRGLIKDSGMRVLGPNTAGLVNLNDGYVPRSAHNQLDPDRVKPGMVALVTQSGACSNILFNQAQANGVGVGLSISTGDQIDLDLWDLCRHELDDDRIQIVLVVAETLGDTRRLESVAAHAAERGKLMALLKLGRSEMGRRAVMTHSGSLAGDAAVQSAALRQLGVLEVDSLDDLWELAMLVQSWGKPTAGPYRLGIVAYSGGEGALIADGASTFGLELPPPSQRYQDFIRTTFEYATAANPFDPSGEIIARPDKIELALRGFLEQNDYTEVLIASPVLRPEQAERQLGTIDHILHQPRPNVAFSYQPAGDLTDTQDRILAALKQPLFRGSNEALRAISHYRAAGQRRTKIRVNEAPGGADRKLAEDARYFEVRAELGRLGITFAPAALVSDAADARAKASALGLPVVMKANVPSSTHKFANGLIVLNVATLEQVEDAYRRLEAAGRSFGADGVVVEAIGRGQLEVMIGATRDPDFGAAMVFGAGGMTVEYAHDSALAVVRYMNEADAEALVRSTRIGAFVADRAPAVVATLAQILGAVASFFASNTQLSGLDLNPLIVDLVDKQLTCVDARVA
jgi:acyl-CoA synthetase (NDP forming)